MIKFNKLSDAQPELTSCPALCPRAGGAVAAIYPEEPTGLRALFDIFSIPAEGRAIFNVHR
jgi:hypothetical protein